jgi:hypothetical protein
MSCARLILTDAWIFTGLDAAPFPGSVAIADGRILRLGSAAQCLALRGPETEVISGREKLIAPGFIDCHLHPFIGIEDLLDCQLGGAATLAEYLERLQSSVQRFPHAAFIRGNGWQYQVFGPDGPRKELLDRIIPDKPVFLKAFDGHSGWVNSQALTLAGITRDSVSPPGGIIEKDPVTGEPTGFLREWPAMGLVFGLLPKAGPAELAAGFLEFQQQAVRHGITAIHDARGKDRFLPIYADLRARGQLALRVRISLFGDPRRGPEQLPEVAALREELLRQGLECSSLKVFLDGVVEGHTAYLGQPYADRPGERGHPIWDEAHFLEMMPEFDRAGWQLHFHAVGDGAVHLALNGLERARQRNGARDSRHHIAHADLISENDIPRFRELDVTAHLQPAWFYRDANYSTVTLPQLGEARARRLYATRALVSAGARVACSSDWPFGGDYLTFSPLEAMQIGVTRRRLQPSAEPPLNPEQALTLAELWRGYSAQAAFLEFRDRTTGTLREGFAADVIVLDRNPFRESPATLAQSRVLLTLIQGEPVWRDPSL